MLAGEINAIRANGTLIPGDRPICEAIRRF
jgi:hypothetical protein